MRQPRAWRREVARSFAPWLKRARALAERVARAAADGDLDALGRLEAERRRMLLALARDRARVLEDLRALEARRAQLTEEMSFAS
ncbi:MAG: hypothetical protein D6771_03880, partial [Zetaproteobacteria bacterium]